MLLAIRNDSGMMGKRIEENEGKRSQVPTLNPCVAERDESEV